MSTNCPNCGKPVRPGARFCGNCGTTMALPVPPQAQDAADQQQEASAAQAKSSCPFCSSPVRPEAKFCPVCGKVLTPAPVKQEAPVVQPQPAQPVALPVALPVAQAPVAVPAAGSGGQKDSTKGQKASKTKGGRKPLTLWLVGILVVLLLAIAGIILVVDPFDLWGEGDANPVQEETVSPTPSTEGTSPAVTPTAATPSAAIPTASITPTIQSGVVITPGLGTGTPSPGEPVPGTLLLDDPFTGPLAANWQVWGAEGMVTSNGRMELKSPIPGDAGANSIITIPLEAGIVIQFQAGLMGDGDADQLWFDWYPADVTRQASTPPGPLHLSLLPGELNIQTNQASVNLTTADNGAHLYEVRILADLKVSIVVDGKVLTQLPLGTVDGLGPISFTGQGWVDDVKVYGP